MSEFWLWFIRPLAEVLGVLFAFSIIGALWFGIVTLVTRPPRKKK